VDHRADTRQELLEGCSIEITIDLIRRLIGKGVDNVLRRAHKRLIVDVRRHVLWIKQPGLVVRMLRVRGRPTGKEVPAESAAGRADVEDAIEVLAIHLLAAQELGLRLNLLPGGGHAPVTFATGGGPLFR
jgi:hypothetical protein